MSREKVYLSNGVAASVLLAVLLLKTLIVGWSLYFTVKLAQHVGAWPF